MPSDFRQFASQSEHLKDGFRGFLVPTDTPGFSAPLMKHKWSLRMSVTSELVLEDVRLPADAELPGANGLASALTCLTQARYGISWGDAMSIRDVRLWLFSCGIVPS